ncbi:ROK family protein [Paenibacillus hamazuiensis]|uniref:ROK family protein n=1 Tax=Paenibacillus hamazuiensis TaxID=2936508 RepID=UPI00200C877B|nr:ROK family protein [Paenibacillus hamazuiensis]
MSEDHTGTVAGIDVGGTKISIGLVDADGRIVRSARYPMDRREQASALGSIDRALDDFMSGGSRSAREPLAIGLCMPGQIDPARGAWVHCLSIPIGSEVPLAALLQERYGAPAFLDNDVKAATLAEQRWGGGRGHADFVYVNVGTGIACGIVSGGQLVRGAGNYAGEIGHMSVDPSGAPCKCGSRGCLENIASGGGMISRVRELLPQFPDSSLHGLERSGGLNSSAVFAAYRQGDALAAKVSEDAVAALETALVSLVNLTNPQAVILGGGVFRDEWLAGRLREHVAAHSMPAARKSLASFQLSQLTASDVGLLGAASLAWEGIK